MIELKNITKTYQMGENIIPVLRGIKLTINEGDLIAIMGPSGSGKSTLMNIIGLLDRPTQGSYLLHNQEVSKLSSDTLAELRNHTIGFIFQAFFLLPRLNALQNVTMPLSYRPMLEQEKEERAKTLLTKVGVGELAKHKPSEMSGGQQQRVAIARALVTEPKIILADEPTGALDTKTGQAVMDLLIDINHKLKTTVIIVTHDPKIAEQCERVVHIQDGLIRIQESTE